MEAGLNSDPGNDSFSDKIRDAKHVDRSTHYSTCLVPRVHKNKSMQHHTSGSGTAEFQVT